MGLSGQRILVTGASRGIGCETVRQLAADGARVLALGRARDALEELARATGCEPLVADLAQPEAAAELVGDRLPLDALVNCAGVVEVEPFLNTSERNFLATWTVNALAPMRLSQVVAEDLIRRRQAGVIVNVSSIAASVGTPGHTAYCASKAALDAITRVMAVELGAHGIRVNSVNPVVTWTPMAQKAWSDPEKAARMKARIPLGRFAEPAEVAATIRYLLDPASAMIHGVCLPVDGGFTAG